MEHISTLVLTMPVPDDNALANVSAYQIAPFLQGVLMENVDELYAQTLHSLSFNPYSQYCLYDKESHQLHWRVSTLTDEAAEHIIEPLQKRSHIEVKRFDTKCPISEKTLTSTTLQSITNIIGANMQNKGTIEFVTPTSFKSGGKYIIFPTIRLVFQNLLMRYGYVYGNEKEVEEEVLDYFENNLVVSSYSLRSRYFNNAAQENKKIPAFLGSVTVSASGPKHQLGLMQMLLKFAEYSGIGIKTSMGMGGVRCS